MIERMTEWHMNELAQADKEGAVEVLAVPREDARRLFDSVPEGPWSEEFADYLDQAQGDCTDGQPRYLVLKISQ